MINLLVTGGCGFIASNFINYVHAFDKYNIINLDAMYYCANENNIDEKVRSSSRYKLIKGNICSEQLVDSVLNEYKITHVIHFAAQSFVDASFSDPIQHTTDNILGTHVLLESCRKLKNIQRFIYVSTDEVYGESMLEELPKTEQSMLCPTNPYAATKAGAELISRSYYYSFKFPVIVTRCNNVYGKNQYPEKLIPKFIELLNSGKRVTIHGDGSALRSFLHVDDASKAFLLILEEGKIGEIYNIGSERCEYSVLEVAKILIKIIKKSESYDDYITYVDDRPYNDKRYCVDNDKIEKLGWKFNIDFIDGVERLVKNNNKI